MAQNPINQSAMPGVDLLDLDALKSDTVSLEVPIRGFIIGGAAGTISLVTAAGNTFSLPATLALGVIHSIGARRINSTGTTATGLIGVV